MSNEALIPYGQTAMETLEESLSRQFYGWEKRGRGWQVYDYPVEIEPHPRPFYFSPPPERPAVDDAQVQTFFSRLFNSGGGNNNSLARTAYREELEEYKRSFNYDDGPDECNYYHEQFVELRLLLPEDLRPAKITIEQFLSSLDHTSNPVAFEVIGTQDQVTVQFCATRTDLRQVKQQFAAHLPAASFIEGEDLLINTWINADHGSCIVDFGLSREFFLPLGTVSNLEVDPLIAIVGAMSQLDEDDVGVFQVLFKKARFDWPDAIIDAVTRLETTEFLSYLPDARSLSKEKIRSPFYAAIVRVAAKSRDDHSAMRIVRNISGGLSQLTRPGGNELLPLSNDGYDDGLHETALLDRFSFRGGMLLNREELVSLAHPPASTVREEKLIRVSTRTRPAPANTQSHALRLGLNEHQNESRRVTLSNDQRTRHMHVIGSSGSGKSTLLLSMIKQDLEAGHGLCVLDPHGDLIDDVINHIPESRVDDVILFDPSDADFPVAFNILEAKTELEKTILSSDLIATFRRMSTSWGDVMDSVLANAILAFVENTRGGTLFDLKRFLVEQDLRNEVLKTATDQSVRYFWEHEFPLISGKPQSSILIRLDAFLRQKLIRNIVCQKDMKFNFRDVMDRKKILLLKLSQGLIGEENAYLLGTLLVSKIYQTALTRQDSSTRPYFWLYIDEFHHFITPSMERVLAGTRKYNLGLILAHQEFRQMQSRSQDVASSVLSNCYTRICFRMGDTDAEKFAGGFSFFDAKALQNLGIGEAIARVERAEYDFNLQTEMLAPSDNDVAEDRRKRVQEAARSNYGRSRSEVEAEISIPNPQNFATPEKESVRTDRPSQANEEEPRASKGAKPQVDLGAAAEHRHLQNLIKRVGERYGFISIIEKELFGGAGRVDVALSNGDLKIACEIAMTNSPDFEVGNLQKCVAAGFDIVLVVGSDPKHLSEIRKLAEDSMSSGNLTKVSFVATEFVAERIKEYSHLRPSPPHSEPTTKGYRIMTKQADTNKTESKRRGKVILDILAGALGRRKKPPTDNDENQ